MAPKNIEYTLLQSASSVEEFLKTQFHCSSNKLKKYFDKSFLNRSLNEKSTLSLPLNFVNDGEINPVYSGPEIKIINDDELFLVLDKPENVFVHPLSYDEKNNCLSFLRSKNFSCLNVNREHYDRGLLYRLDFETSGVLIYVKSAEAYLYLREHFKTVAKKKIYRCLVDGKCELQGSYKHFFSSRDIKGKKVVVSDAPNESAGELKLNPLHYDSKKNQTLMEVELKTGLRHQIRAQLSFLGFPLVGDEFYGGSPSDRLYLHAYQYDLEFNQKLYSFQSLPKF